MTRVVVLLTVAMGLGMVAGCSGGGGGEIVVPEKGSAPEPRPGGVPDDFKPKEVVIE